MSDELKPCPHCEVSQVELTQDDEYGYWQVICGGCGSSSGLLPDRPGNKEKIIEAWNARADDKRRCENCRHDGVRAMRSQMSATGPCYRRIEECSRS